MAFKVTTIYKRPSLDTPWQMAWFFGKSAQEYLDLQEGYQMESRRVIRGGDTLTLTVENTWDNEEQFHNYINELAFINHMIRVEEYHLTCGITTEPRVFQSL